MTESSEREAGEGGGVARVPAIVLAGGRTSRAFAEEAGVAHRALAEVGGLPMVAHVVRALRETECVSAVTVAAPPGFPERAWRPPGGGAPVSLLETDAGLEENLRRGLAAARAADPEAEYALITTADIPFVHPAALRDYVHAALATGADCIYAAIPRERCVACFPEMKRTYLPAPSGHVTGGNVVVQRIATYERQAETLRRAYAARKNPLALARIIGGANLLRLVARRLELPHIEEAAGRLMGVRVRLLVTPHAELGTDIDRPADLRLARSLLAGTPPPENSP